MAMGATLLVAATALIGRDPDPVPSHEAELFRTLNGAPDRLSLVLWPTMQLGNGLMAIAVPSLVVANSWPDTDWDYAIRGAAAAFGGWQLAKAIKLVVNRGRPAAYLDQVHFRDGVPDGLGFVSGHATVAAAVAAVVCARQERRAVRSICWSLAATVGLARVYVGAHLPLDVVGGAGLGALWGGLLAKTNPSAPRSTRSIKVGRSR